MAHLKVITGMVCAALMSSTALAQTTTIVEPVPQYKTLDSIPHEYTDAGVLKAQHIKPGDISPEEYAKLLEEADRVRAFQSTQGTYTGVTYGETTQTVVTETAPTTSYDVQIFDTQPAAPITYADTTTYTPITNVPLSTVHRVTKGDTLYNISKRFGVKVADLRARNGLTDNAIKLGQMLTIPAVNTTIVTQAPVMAPVTSVTTESTTWVDQPRTTTLVRNVQPIPASGIYAVLPGDTMYSIARRACVSVSGIVAENGIVDATAIKPGQRLTMPQGHCLN